MRAPGFTLLRTLLVTSVVSLGVGCASTEQPAGERAAPAGSQAAQTHAFAGDDFAWSKSLADDARVEVYGILGTVAIEPASGDTLDVRGTKSGRGDLDSVEIEVVEAGDRVIVCAVYPGGRCDADGYHGGHEGTIEVQVDLSLSLPAGRAMTARTVNGSVTAHGLTGELDVETVSGNIKLDTSGRAAAETVNGSIVAELPRGLGDDLRLKTVNGTVRVELPSSVDAQVSASTVNGAIESNFPLEVSHRIVGGHASGRLGNGGPQLELDTVNGSIRIHRVDRA